jgi:uncharacterized Zn finger protein
MSFWRHFSRSYRPSIPRQARGGIKAQSRQGAFAKSWWGRRWTAVLEEFHIGARLGRGKSYARSGQVVGIDVEKGRVAATVQGSRVQPYRVAIRVKTLSPAEWRKLGRVLGRQAIFAAKLLAGEMPENIEEAFKEAGLSLFPGRRNDLKTECSCPDWSNPCKHIAAVYYLLGEEFDRDPFLMFKLRGLEREALVDLLGEHSSGRRARGAQTTGVPSPLEHDAELRSEPRASDPEEFWGLGARPTDAGGEVRIPSLPAALPKRLGNFPFWRGEENFLGVMEEIYSQASHVGLFVVVGEPRVSGVADGDNGRGQSSSGKGGNTAKRSRA